MCTNDMNHLEIKATLARALAGQRPEKKFRIENSLRSTFVGHINRYWPASTHSAPNRAGNCAYMLNFMFSSNRNERQIADGGIGVSLKQNSTHIEV